MACNPSGHGTPVRQTAKIRRGVPVGTPFCRQKFVKNHIKKRAVLFKILQYGSAKKIENISENGFYLKFYIRTGIILTYEALCRTIVEIASIFCKLSLTGEKGDVDGHSWISA